MRPTNNKHHEPGQVLRAQIRRRCRCLKEPRQAGPRHLQELLRGQFQGEGVPGQPEGQGAVRPEVLQERGGHTWEGGPRNHSGPRFPGPGRSRAVRQEGHKARSGDIRRLQGDRQRGTRGESEGRRQEAQDAPHRHQLHRHIRPLLRGGHHIQPQVQARKARQGQHSVHKPVRRDRDGHAGLDGDEGLQDIPLRFLRQRDGHRGGRAYRVPVQGQGHQGDMRIFRGHKGRQEALRRRQEVKPQEASPAPRRCSLLHSGSRA